MFFHALKSRVKRGVYFCIERCIRGAFVFAHHFVERRPRFVRELYALLVGFCRGPSEILDEKFFMLHSSVENDRPDAAVYYRRKKRQYRKRNHREGGVRDVRERFVQYFSVCSFHFRLTCRPEPIHWLQAFIRSPPTSRQRLIANSTW